MTLFNTFWGNALSFLVVLTILVFVHELGHYLVARLNRVRVEVFSIGFGPKIYGWTDRAGTLWKISAIPLGGYIKMFGEKDGVGWGEEERPMTAAEKAVSFHHKKLSQRAAVVAAGPAANFLFSIVVLAGLFGFLGEQTPLAGVGSVQEDSAAAEAGFQPGDRILAVAGTDVRWFEDLRSIVSAAPGESLRFTVDRGDGTVVLEATPQPFEITGEDGSSQTIGRLGVTPDPDQVVSVRQGLFGSIGLAVERTWSLCIHILTYLGDVITGQESADQLGGPIQIAVMSGDMARAGLVSLIGFMAALSVNLGLINLFPIPILDGGHLLFYAYEAIRGKPPSERVQNYGLQFGLVFLLFIMVLATWNDVSAVFQ